MPFKIYSKCLATLVSSCRETLPAVLQSYINESAYLFSWLHCVCTIIVCDILRQRTLSLQSEGSAIVLLASCPLQCRRRLGSELRETVGGAQVRCACRRKREKRACSSVRLQLASQNAPADFDASSAVQLLECDAKCMQIKVRLLKDIRSVGFLRTRTLFVHHPGPDGWS